MILKTLSGSVLIEAVLIARSISIFSFLLLQNSTLGEGQLNNFPASLVYRVGFRTIPVTEI